MEHTSELPHRRDERLGSRSPEGCSGDMRSCVFLACYAREQSHQRKPLGKGMQVLAVAS